MLKDLYNIRTDQNLSIRQLAVKSGVSKSVIHKIETGKISPRINTVCMLARGLNIEPGTLFLILIDGEKY